MIRLAVSGALGKMGARIIALAGNDADLKVSACIERSGHPDAGKKTGGFVVTDNLDSIKSADVLIEFTTPEVTLQHLDAAVKFKKSMVIGTTGLTDLQKKQIKELSKKIPIVYSVNMSVGVNLLFKIVKDASSTLKDYTVKISEAHHVHKKDAPSGTAKHLAQIIKDSQGKEVKDVKSLREGEIVGNHEVIFESPLDTVKISHSAKTRDIFAQGALQAAKWIARKNAGLYDMQDVLAK